MKHGNESFLIEGGLIDAPLFPEVLFHGENGRSGVFPRDLKPKSGELLPKPTRKFCRLFEKGEQPCAEGLIKLGLSMETETTQDSNDNQNTEIPAGYTYLGQFIDHDITLDRKTELTVNGKVEPGCIENFRTPSLDLDSLYGNGPDCENSKCLYKDDKRTFEIGKTSPVDNLGLGIFDNDLPRQGNGPFNPEYYVAIIGDHRNDENLAVAQTHLAFLKFHNALADADPTKSFEDLRREVTLHYQAIILTDFLPKILDQEVLNDVLQNGRKFYTDDKKDCMPIEFSVAAHRLGHSMVRPSYQWNRIHNEATLKELFEFSGGSGSRGPEDKPFADRDTLPSDWIINWKLFYDLSEVGKDCDEQLNYARKLDTNIAVQLKKLPEFQKMAEKVPAPLLSLATRNLLRGRLVSLPSGQEVAAAVGETALTPEEILRNVTEDQAKILKDKDHDFDEVTPLWYYILREAMVQANGNHLGKVGSRIVAETFVGLIENSPINVRSERPALSFSMRELLMELPYKDINPLGC